MFIQKIVRLKINHFFKNKIKKIKIIYKNKQIIFKKGIKKV
jgi:hypothetical protein